MNAYVIIYFSLRLFFAFFLSLFLPLIIVVEHSNIHLSGPLMYTFHFSSSQKFSPLNSIINKVRRVIEKKKASLSLFHLPFSFSGSRYAGIREIGVWEAPPAKYLRIFLRWNKTYSKKFLDSKISSESNLQDLMKFLVKCSL